MKVCDMFPCKECSFGQIPVLNENDEYICRKTLQDIIDSISKGNGQVVNNNNLYSKVSFYDSFIEDIEDFDD